MKEKVAEKKETRQAGQEAVRVRLRLFAIYREAVGERERLVDLPPGATPLGLWRQLAQQYPRLQAYRNALVVAINGEYAPLEQPLRDGDEVAFIPPVSGGALYRIVEEEISLDELSRAVASPEMGAIVTFLGTARRHSRGREVEYLEYDAYPEMALSKMREIGEEIRRRWGTDRVAMIHRVGRLKLGEASVGIAVATPHRREAFEACRYAIDRLKELAPIWKKEVWVGGAEWIEEGGPPNLRASVDE